MLHGFLINVKDLHMSTRGSNSTLPLRMSASPYKPDGMPYGLVASNGLVYSSLPEGLPALIAYNDGGVEIRSNFNAKNVAEARFVVSGSALLVEDGKPVTAPSQLNLRVNVSIERMGVGTLKNGLLLFIEQKCTLKQLQAALYKHGCVDAIMLAYGDVYLDYPRGGISMGYTPVTTFEALTFKEIPHPITIIDIGHGGIDPGACAFGSREKDFNLAGGLLVHKFLTQNYDGTFLLTRSDDRTLSLKERTDMINAVGADFMLSLHVNASDNGGTGYETFTYPDNKPINLVEQEIQRVLHKEVMSYLAPFGFVDRGMKRANFHMLRESKCPSVLVENLFINQEKDINFLRDPVTFRELYLATARGFAKGVGLLPKVIEDDVEDDEQYYRVQVGAYKFKKNAEVMAETLKSKGFDAYITKY